MKVKWRSPHRSSKRTWTRTRLPAPIAAGMVLTLLGVSFQTLAYEDCRERGGAKYDPPIVNLRIDNDLFGAEQQAQGYSHGFGLTLVSPNLVDYTDDPSLPRPPRSLNRHPERLAPAGLDHPTMVVSFRPAPYHPPP